jgi:hypothetical protein
MEIPWAGMSELVDVRTNASSIIPLWGLLGHKPGIMPRQLTDI